MQLERMRKICFFLFFFVVSAEILENIRLPKNIIPKHYAIQIQPFLEPDNFTFKGITEITVDCVSDDRNITLHVNNLTIDEVRILKEVTNENLTVVNVTQDKERQFLIVHTEDVLNSGYSYRLTITYTGYLNDKLAGFYRSSYLDDNGNKRWLATTQFSPVDARRAFPCFDEPEMKATFDISIIRKKNMISLSNMNKWVTIEIDDEWHLDIYNRTVPMSTYLVAFIVTDFTNINNETYSFWTKPSSLSSAKYALSIAPNILHYFEDYFDIPYPLPKLDMIAIPDMAPGAMENWGLITFRESRILYNESQDSLNKKSGLASIMAHELAHQWFGNLVSAKWWDNLWLKEGFATYMSYLGVDFIHPEWKVKEEFIISELQSVMELDSLDNSHPIFQPVYNPSQISEIFDMISYNKGPTIIRMMEHFLGTDIFRKGLQAYLKEKSYGNANQDEFWNFMTQAETDPKLDVKEIMDTWLLQAGYPVVTIIRNYENNSAELQQEKFSTNSSQKSQSIWNIPITYTDSIQLVWNGNVRMWLKDRKGQIDNITGPNEWILLNLKQIGYYRVNYDDRNWNLLTNQLKYNHTIIHSMNRAQIIDDTFDLARSDRLSYNVPLNLSLYLWSEREYIPWRAAFNSFYFHNNFLKETSVYEIWKQHIISLLKPTYEEFTWTEKLEDLLKENLRTDAFNLMCHYDFSNCTEEATKIFSEWIQNNDTSIEISPSLKSTWFCTGMRQKSEDEWNVVWERYLITKSISDKYILLKSLTCTEDTKLLYRLLNSTITPSSDIRTQDGSYIIRWISFNKYGKIAFHFVIDNWQRIFETYGNSLFGLKKIVDGVTKYLNTEEELEKLVNFYNETQHNVGSAKKSFEQGIERTRNNINWMKNYFEIVRTWLLG